MKDSFSNKIEPNIYYEPNSGCWLWTKSTMKNGYAQMRFNGKTRTVHRIIAELFLGLDASNHKMFVCHKCDTRPCINPSHFFLGTVQDNADDAVKKDRIRRDSSHHRSTLTSDNIKEIFEMFNSGKSCSFISKKFKVGIPAISMVLNKKIYRRLSEGLHKTRETKQKPVICLSDGLIFESSRKASAYYGFSDSLINRCINGELKKTHGLVFSRMI